MASSDRHYTERFLRRILRLERAVKNLSTQPQLQNSSIEDGNLQLNDNTSGDQMVISPTDITVNGDSLIPKYANDSMVITAPGDQTFYLSHIPLPNSEHLYWGGAYLKGANFSRVDGSSVLIIPDPDGRFKAGRVLTCEYAYIKDASVTEPTPPLDPIEVFTTVTYARLIRHSTADGYDDDAFVTMGSSTTIDFYPYFGGPTGDTATNLYIVEMDGHPFPSEDYIPATPDGYSLGEVRPWITGYISGDPQVAWGGGSGYLPEPTLSPFFVMDSTNGLSFDTFGTTYPPPAKTYGGADDTSLAMPGGGGGLADNVHVEGLAGTPATTHLILTGFGYRFTFEPL